MLPIGSIFALPAPVHMADNTLHLLGREGLQVPAQTAWYLADLGEARGKQELFKRQMPQKLKVLLEHALIESAVSSNRIEGVNIDPKRAWTLVLGAARYRDRNEEEVRGYRDALKLVHESGTELPIEEETVLELFVVSRCLFERQFFPFFTVNSGVIKNLTIFAYKVKEKFGRPKRIGEMS